MPVGDLHRGAISQGCPSFSFTSMYLVRRAPMSPILAHGSAAPYIVAQLGSTSSLKAYGKQPVTVDPVWPPSASIGRR